MKASEERATMNMTTLIALGILIVLVVLYVGRRKSRLRREDLD